MDVERHLAEPDARLLKIYLEQLQNTRFPEHISVNNFDGLMVCGFSAAAYASLQPEAKPGLAFCLRTVACAAANLYALETSPEETVELYWFGAGPWLVSTQKPSALTGPAHWRKSLSCALMARDSRARRVFQDASLEKLRTGVQADECSFLHINALQLYLRGDPRAPQVLLDALTSTAPEKLHPDSIDYTLSILVPEIDLLFQLMRKEQAEFNRALKDALLAHRTYYGAEERATEREGQLAWGPLGLCCLARDAGWSIEVTSGYIPRWIIEGDLPPL